MNKEEVEGTFGGHKAKLVLGDPADKKKADKLSAMRIAMTYIETQRLKVSPERAIQIADEFLEWLEK